MCNGYFSINRSIFDSWVFADPKTLKIWLWMIGKARHKKGYIPLNSGKGVIAIEINRGQFVFGRNKAAEALFMDGQYIYRKIKEFEKKEMIKIDSNNQYSIITICKYDEYQSNIVENEQPMNNQRTTNEQQLNSEQTTNEQPMNTNNNVNNVNKVNKVNNSIVDRKVGDKSPTHKKDKIKPKSPKEREDGFRKSLWETVKKERPQYKSEKEELKKFFDYWSERSPRGKKMKCEKQSTFDPAKRLDTWFRNKAEKTPSSKNDGTFYRNEDRSQFEGEGLENRIKRPGSL